jgi:hypothetical protein
LDPTYGDLGFNPCWDDLRGDKRFDKIVAAAQAATKEFIGFASSCPKPLYLHTPLGKNNFRLPPIRILET